MKAVLASLIVLLLLPITVRQASADPPDLKSDHPPGQETQPQEAQPLYNVDRGPGIPTSMFGTYVRPGELLVYPFLEYYRDRNAEYSPQELGFGPDQDFRGDYEATEYLLFLGYGLSDRVSLELEAAGIRAELEKSPLDPSPMPEELAESGLGDVQTEINWLWRTETPRRPGFFSYGEVAFPFQRTRRLIGTQDWEFKLGTGMLRGFSWGATTIRGAVEYDHSERSVGMAEFAVEYLKRLSSTWKVFAAVEGSEDEWEGITEIQIHLSDRAFVKLNSSVGLTSKATGWAPETGVVFRF